MNAPLSVSLCCSSLPHSTIYPDDLDKHWTTQPIWHLYDTGMFQQSKNQNIFCCLSWRFGYFLFTGRKCVFARLPEQHGLRLEATQLHGGRFWGEYTPCGTAALGLFWWITEKLILIADPKRSERHSLCCRNDLLAWGSVTPWLHTSCIWMNVDWNIWSHFWAKDERKWKRWRTHKSS